MKFSINFTEQNEQRWVKHWISNNIVANSEQIVNLTNMFDSGQLLSTGFLM